MARAPLADVIARHVGDLQARPAVVGVGEGRTDDDQPCILVFLQAPDAGLPAELEGWPVRAASTGPFDPRVP